MIYKVNEINECLLCTFHYLGICFEHGWLHDVNTIMNNARIHKVPETFSVIHGKVYTKHIFTTLLTFFFLNTIEEHQV